MTPEKREAVQAEIRARASEIDKIRKAERRKALYSILGVHTTERSQHKFIKTYTGR